MYQVTILLALLLSCGCSSRLESEVVLACTVDQDIAAPMLGAFYRSEEGKVSPKARFGLATMDRIAFADEITGKTDGFVADVLWSDDIYLMSDLSRRGLLAEHDWQVDPTVSRNMFAKNKTWRAFAATARVLIINTDLIDDPSKYPKSVNDLVDERWKQQCAIAVPTYGPPAVHAGIMASEKGVKETADWFDAVAKNAVVMKRDAQVATAVAKGQIAWGLTSSADAAAEQDASLHVAVVFPDQDPGQSGTVLVPHAVAILKTASHPYAAASLASFLVSPATEDRLAMSDAAQIPVSRLATHRPRVLSGESVRWAQSDYDLGARSFESLEPMLETIFSND